MATTNDTRQAVRERKILQSESRWLQKALFALSKAVDDRDKLESEDMTPMTVTIEGKTYEIASVTDAIKDAVTERVESLRATLPESRLLAR